MQADVIARLNAALSGRYAIERVVGEGGMATVFVAADLRHPRKVALKVLRPELAAVVGAERFLAEIRTTASLQHPHILPLFDSGEADGFLFYVMPYVGGESLREKLDRERQLHVDEAVRIAASIADALDYAHRRGVIHRDIKPANILLQDGKPVLSDFGIALAVGVAGGGRLTETGLSLGTPHYMSPEQATGEQAVHATTDIYALGCVLYEMLVGEPPYTGSTAQAILGKIIQAEPASAAKTRRSVPANVDAVIRCSLEKIAADRFASARELAAALADPAFRHGEVVAIPSDLARRSQLGAAAVAAVVGGVVTGLAVWSLVPRASPRPALVTRFSVDVPTGVLRPFTAQALELTMDGQVLVLSTGSAPVRSELRDGQVFVRRLETLETIPIPGIGNVGTIFLSPDGTSVGFYQRTEGTLTRVPVGGGPLTTIARIDTTGAGIRGVAWGEDGTIVAAIGTHKGLTRVPDVGGAPTPITTVDDSVPEFHWGPHFLPGAESLLFSIRRPDQPPEVAFLRLSSGETETVTTGDYPQYVPPGYLVVQRENTLWAARFDATAGRVRGEFVPVQEHVRSGERNFTVSRNGSLAFAPVVEFGGARTLAWVDRNGREQPLSVDQRPYVYPRISPRADQLAVAQPEDIAILNGSADIWMIDFDRLTPTRVTFGGNNRFVPTWTSDGTRITYADGNGAANAMLWSPADGTGRADTLLDRDSRRFPTSWSPTGRTLAYHRGPGGTPTSSRDIWTLELLGDSAIHAAFHATPYDDRGATFSPDGRWLAYVSNKSGRDEVYVSPYPGPGRELTISAGGGREPVWSRSGTELFYRSDDSQQMMAVDVLSGPELRAGSPRALFADVYDRDMSGNGAGHAANYDVSPDGSRFLMVRAPNYDEGVIVVINWVEELRRLLGD